MPLYLFRVSLGMCLLFFGNEYASASLILGQIDNFQNNSTQFWQSGPNDPHPPVNVASGGPAGSSDKFLKIQADGSSSGGRLVTWNDGHQWAGNYLTAGISQISMQVKNNSTTDLVLRLVILESTIDKFVTNTPVNVPKGSDWHLVTFNIAPSNLVGGSNVTATLSGATGIELLHDPIAHTNRQLAPDVVAELDVDNITAVPEPSSLLLILCGLSIISMACWQKYSRIIA
jgi:hypothetical protein